MHRPHGRSARIRNQVHRAVIDLLRDRTAGELSIPLVAERSGVHQATIYRRWGSIPVLLNDVAAAGPARTSPLPDTGTLRGDLDGYATGVADAPRRPAGRADAPGGRLEYPTRAGPRPLDHPPRTYPTAAGHARPCRSPRRAHTQRGGAAGTRCGAAVLPCSVGRPTGAEHARRLVDR